MREPYRLLPAFVIVIVAAIGASGASSLPQLGDQFSAACARFEREVGPLTADAYAPASVPPKENAALALLDACALLSAGGEGVDGVAAMFDRPASAWTTSDRANARRVLAAVAPALDRARSASLRAKANFGVDRESPAVAAIPHANELLDLASLLVVDGRLALEDGKDDRTIADSAAIAAMARALRSEPGPESEALQLMVQNAQLLLVRFTVEDAAADVAVLRRMRRTISSGDPLESLERATAYDMVSLLDLVGGSDMVTSDDEAAIVDCVLARTVDATREAVVAMRHGRPPSSAAEALRAEGASCNGLIGPDEMEQFSKIAASTSFFDDGRWNRVRVALAARRLALAALAVRTSALAAGRYPDGAKASLPADGTLRYEVGEDGRVTIADDRAQALNDALDGGGYPFRNDGLVWALPPVAAPAGRN